MLQAYTGTLAQSYLYGGELCRRAERLGPGPELARAYAMNSAGCSSVFPLQRMARFDREQAEQLAAEIGEDSLSAWVSYATSVERGVVGDWKGYFGALERAADLSEVTGNVRQAAECRTVMAQHQLWLGRIVPARAALETLLAVPHGTIDPQHRCWALSGLGLAALLGGRWNDALGDLEQARAELVRRDKIAAVNLHGYLALAAALVGDKERANREATLVLGQIALVPSAFWVRGGVFMATYACCRLDLPLARTGARYLARQAHHFVTCQPAAKLCQGMLGQKESDLWAAVESSRHLHMPIEGGLALYELGCAPEAQAVLSELPGLWRRVVL